MEKASAEFRYARLHEDAPYHDGTFTSWAKEQSTSHPLHYSAGVTIWVAQVDIAPHDEFTTDAQASPIAEGGESDRNEA